MASREKRYAITMAIRMACFVSMIFVPGPMRWVLLAGAVFLPYIAVILANQADSKALNERLQQAPEPEATELTAGPPSPEIIIGELVDDPAPDKPFPHAQPTAYVSHDRVA